MKILTFVIGLLTFSLINAQDITLNKTDSIKPYSLYLDKIENEKLITATRKNVLQNNTIEQIILDSKSSAKKALRLSAIEKLGYIGNDKGRELLEGYLLTDSADEIKIAVARALQIINSPKSKETLLKSLNDKNRIVKIYSALTLSFIGEKEQSQKIFIAFYSQPEEIPYYSIHMGFANIATPEIMQYLIKDLSNENNYVAVDAAITLAQIGNYSSAYQKLLQLQSNSDKYIRMAALRGFAYIGDNMSLNQINTSLNDSDTLVRERAKSILKSYNYSK